MKEINQEPIEGGYYLTWDSVEGLSTLQGCSFKTQNNSVEQLQSWQGRCPKQQPRDRTWREKLLRPLPR
jgi:hypothetical protein